MARILLIRHAESTANTGDVAFGNLKAPLTEKALKLQIPHAKRELIEKYGINPDEYVKPVAVSLYKRTYETAKELGFKNIKKVEILGESEIYSAGELAGVDVIKKHVDEHGWLPTQELSKAQKIIEDIKNGSLDYEIIVSHGMVIAAIIAELNSLGVSTPPFDGQRGYVPLQAQIIQIEI